jgi:hypothetical protein
MRVRLTVVCLLAAVCSLSAQQPGAPPAPRPVPRAGTAVPPGVGGAPPGVPAPTAAQAVRIAEVMAFEKQCDDAAVKGDAAFLERALSSDFIMTHGDGWTTGGMPLKVDTKATWIAYIGKQPLPYVYRNLDSIQVELHGDIAITLGRYRYLPRSSNPDPGAGHLYVWFERVYAKHDGKWQFISHRTVNGPNREADAPLSSSTR